MAFPIPVDGKLSEALTKDLPPAEYHIPDPTLSLWQRVLGQNREKIEHRLKFMLDGAAAGMGRQPTQQEVNALCDITYKEVRTMAWILPLSMAFGAVLSWNGRATYRFPFFQPKFVKFNPENFPSSRAPFVTGAFANRLWHNVRFGCYAITSALCVAPLLGSYSTSVAIATAARDDRLAQFRKDMKPGRLVSLTADQLPLSSLQAQRNKVARGISEAERALEQRQNALAFAKSEDRVAEIAPDTEYIRSRLAEYKAMLKQLDEAIARKRGQTLEGDSASHSEDYASLSASSSAEYQEPQSGAAPEYTTPRETSSSQGGWSQQTSASQSGWGMAESSDGIDFDDASPVAPTARPVSQSSTPTGAGSAWERLRQSSQQQQRPSGTERKGSQGQRGQSGDLGASSEKDEAQREFDQMLERERSADNQGSSGNSRW